VIQGGRVTFFIDQKQKSVQLTRAHLEEDAGKSLHEDFQGMTGIDLNRAGTPLLEIVTEPDLRGAKEAIAYARALHALVIWIGICDGNMQEGSFRCDANVSVRKVGDTKLGTRCEIKNLNSFRFMEQAIEYEAQRQIEILDDRGKIAQESRLYVPDRGETRSMRSKEDAQDYRYFPDPDLLPLVISEDMIARVKSSMPELPAQRLKRFTDELALPASTAAVLTSNRHLSDYFERAVHDASREVVHQTANWIAVTTNAKLNERGIGISDSPVSAEQLRRLMERIADGTLSGKMAKDVDDAMWAGEGTAEEIIRKRGLQQISDAGAIEKLVDEAIAAGAKQVEDYRAGKQKALQSLVGQVMKASKGKANPVQVNEILRRKLAG
jgi:aspartyl-tRNA(Asn)/glutamyl-tRNA(Gln) amidotransferase subunit B